jgi:elongation factor P
MRSFARVSASELRAGDAIEHSDGNVYVVEDQRIARMGMGRAYKQIVLRALKSGLKKDVRFRVDEDVEQVELDRPQKMQVLYTDPDGGTVALMNPETFEQQDVSLSLLGAQAPYVTDGLTVSLQLFQGAPASVTLPPKVVLEVLEVTPLPAGSAKENRDIPAVCGAPGSAAKGEGIRVKVPKFASTRHRHYRFPARPRTRCSPLLPLLISQICGDLGMFAPLCRRRNTTSSSWTLVPRRWGSTSGKLAAQPAMRSSEL